MGAGEVGYKHSDCKPIPQIRPPPAAPSSLPALAPSVPDADGKSPPPPALRKLLLLFLPLSAPRGSRVGEAAGFPSSPPLPSPPPAIRGEHG